MGKQSNRRKFHAMVAESLETRRLLSVSLLKDIATTPVTQPVVQFGGSAYFVASDGAHGYELWKSDGTAAGTSMVRDINPGPGPSAVSALTVANGKLYFSADDGVHGSELWTSDGTSAGTTMVADIASGEDGSAPAMMTELNGKIYFAATDTAHGREIWSSDGTAGGTALAVDANPGSGGYDFTSIIAAGGKLYFASRPASASTRAVWVTDGTQAGTLRLTTAPINVDDLVAIGTTVYFQGINTQLWKTDGTVAGTGLVTDPTPGAGATLDSKIVINGILYFHTFTLSTGEELWRSDGTAAGTYMVKDINPGSGSGVSSSSNFVNVNGTLYFAGNDGVHGYELWKSDGTAAGTVMVREIYSGTSETWMANLTNVNGTLYFRASDGAYGTELWKSDGTEAGTVRISDIAAGYQDADPYGMTAVGSSVVFMASSGVGAGAIYSTNGTLAGTTKVRDLQLPNEGSDPHDLAVMGNNVYFVASPGGNREELWKSDGTPAGTTKVADINPWYHSSWTYLTMMGGRLFFAGADAASGEELWISDGTTAGTHRLKDIWAGYGGSEPQSLTVVGNTLYFVATDGVDGQELWKSDGTAAGTVMVKDINPGIADANISNLVAVDGVLYFTADDGTHGVELWRSGGTAASTSMVSDIQAGAGSSTPSLLTANGSILYFAADDGVHGRELWRAGSSGASLVKDINPGAPGSVASSSAAMIAFGGAVYFTASNGQSGTELWKSDGTSAGTAMLLDIRPGSGGSSVRNLTLFNGKLAFAADGPGGSDDTIWLTDGTTAGTVPAYASGTAPGPYIGAYGMSIAGENLYFWSDDGETRYGQEVWRTDGTQAGTMLVKDVNPGPSDAHYGGYNYIVTTAGVAFFVADDGETGYELWAITLPAPSIAPASTQEGGTVELSASNGTSDDPVTYAWDLDNDGIFGEVGVSAEHGDETGRAPTFSAADLDGPSTFPVAVRASNSSGASVAHSLVAITNTAPTPVIDPFPAAGVEGDIIHLTGSATDFTADVDAGIQFAWVVRRGTTTVATATGPSYDFVASDNGQYTITLTASDKDGGTASVTAALSVANVAPSGTFADTTAAAGVTTVLTVTNPSDPSTADVSAGLLYSFDLNNDGTFETPESKSPSTTALFATPGPRSVRVRMRDKDGGETIYTAIVYVAMPPAPTAPFSSSGTVNEGSSGSVYFATPIGAGPFMFSYDFDNDGTFEIANVSAATATVPAAYLNDGPFRRVVHGRVTDSFGQYTDYTATIAVANVEPTIVIPAAANGSVVLGTDFVLSLSAQDPGQDGVTGWHVDWGDGKSSELALAAALLTHGYAAAGTYELVATATDEDGTYVATQHITVSAAVPTGTFAEGSMAADGSAYRFTVTYADDLAIDASSLGDGDLEITGPAGTALARLVSYAPASNGHGGVATYDVSSPLGTWSWQDNGNYAAAIRTGEIRDMQGIELPAGQIGEFNVSLAAPIAPDLVPQFAGALPKSIAPGRKNTVSVKVYNRGSKALPATSVTTRLYLSADGTVDASDLLLATSTQRLTLGINGSQQIKFSFASPSMQTGGTYRILAVTDAAGAVAERDERNNVAISAATSVPSSSPDLAVSFSKKPKAKYKAGDKVAVSVKIANSGNAQASGTAGLRLYFSTNPILDDSDALALTKTVSVKLKAKASSVFNVQVPSTTAGTYYLLAVVDGEAIGDHLASNNTASAGPVIIESGPAKSRTK